MTSEELIETTSKLKKKFYVVNSLLSHPDSYFCNPLLIAHTIKIIKEDFYRKEIILQIRPINSGVIGHRIRAEQIESFEIISNTSFRVKFTLKNQPFTLVAE